MTDTVAMVPVVSVVPTWKTQTAFGSPCASRTRSPVMPAEVFGQQETAGASVLPRVCVGAMRVVDSGIHPVKGRVRVLRMGVGLVHYEAAVGRIHRIGASASAGKERSKRDRCESHRESRETKGSSHCFESSI